MPLSLFVFFLWFLVLLAFFVPLSLFVFFLWFLVLLAFSVPLSLFVFFLWSSDSNRALIDGDDV